MGQYFIPVNVTKKEYIHAHAFGDGLKMGEWTHTGSRTMQALKALQASRWKGDEVVYAGDYEHEELYQQAREEFRDVSEIAKGLLSGASENEVSDVRCFNKDCNGGQSELRYVQKSFEYHSMQSMPDEDGYVDLLSLEDSVTDDLFDPYIKCEKCNGRFHLDGTPKK